MDTLHPSFWAKPSSNPIMNLMLSLLAYRSAVPLFSKDLGYPTSSDHYLFLTSFLIVAKKKKMSESVF